MLGCVSLLRQRPPTQVCLLSVTALVGDIKVFAHCPRLRVASVGGGRGRLPITGSVRVFGGCPLLEEFRAFKSCVDGDLEVFAQKCPNLKELSAMKSQVGGRRFAALPLPPFNAAPLTAPSFLAPPPPRLVH